MELHPISDTRELLENIQFFINVDFSIIEKVEKINVIMDTNIIRPEL